MRLLAISVFSLLLITSCNVFSPIDTSGSSLEACKDLNDKGDYEAAVKACQDAVTANPTDQEAQLELADSSLSALGINIKALSDVFLKSSNGTITITQLAESIIAAGKINNENAVASKTHAQEAIAAFDSYGALLVAQGSADAAKVSAFYSTLSRLCYVSLLMAYADVGPNGDHNGLVEKRDICSSPTGCDAVIAAGGMCVNSIIPCDGMDNGDALEAANTLLGISTQLSTLGLGDLQKAVDSMTAIKVPDPAAIPPFSTTVALVNLGAAYKADGGREMLRQIAR
ncbi:MAG: hypothetical protein WCQ53_08885 [bacterium]